MAQCSTHLSIPDTPDTFPAPGRGGARRAAGRRGRHHESPRFRRRRALVQHRWEGPYPGGSSRKVVAVEMWTGGCINCVNTLPSVKHWDEKYRAKGLVIVGVHSPRAPARTFTAVHAGPDRKVWHQVPSRDGQRLPNLGRLQELLLADALPDRPAHGHSLQAHRRRRVRYHGSDDRPVPGRIGYPDPAVSRKRTHPLEPCHRKGEPLPGRPSLESDKKGALGP